MIEYIYSCNDNNRMGDYIYSYNDRLYLHGY